MLMIKTALIASALSLTVEVAASAQGQEKTGPEGNYLPSGAPSSRMTAPVGQTPANGDYKKQAAPSSAMHAPVGQTPANGDYKPTVK